MNKILKLVVDNTTNEKDKKHFFEKNELKIILDLYAKMVSQGSWKDYGLSISSKQVGFSVFKNTAENALYRICKNFRPKNKNLKYSITDTNGKILKNSFDLNVLLRILNERKYGEEDIPLLTAIATSNPTADEYYNEPLDPANLDRFVIQVNSNGISYGKQWEDVKKVISLYATKNGANNFVAKVGKKALDDSYKNLQSVVIPVEVQEGLVSFITWLVEDQRLNESNSVISDRTFLVKSLKLIKASAVIDNRNEANLSDLKVLKFLLPFRVPEEILEAAEQKLESLENQKKKTKK